MKHKIKSYNTRPIGDGMYEIEYECVCEESLSVIKSNGTLYNEHPGEFIGYTPKNLSCKLLRKILEEEKWS